MKSENSIKSKLEKRDNRDIDWIDCKQSEAQKKQCKQMEELRKGIILMSMIPKKYFKV